MEKLMTVIDVAKRFDVSRVAVYAWNSAGRMPRPIQRPGKGLGWTVKSIDQFEEAFAKERLCVESVDFARDVCEIASDHAGIHAEFRTLAGLGLRLLNTSKLPVRRRAEIADMLSGMDWSRAKKPTRAEVAEAKRINKNMRALFGERP